MLLRPSNHHQDWNARLRRAAPAVGGFVGTGGVLGAILGVNDTQHRSSWDDEQKSLHVIRCTLAGFEYAGLCLLAPFVLAPVVAGYAFMRGYNYLGHAVAFATEGTANRDDDA